MDCIVVVVGGDAGLGCRVGSGKALGTHDDESLLLLCVIVVYS